MFGNAFKGITESHSESLKAHGVHEWVDHAVQDHQQCDSGEHIHDCGLLQVIEGVRDHDLGQEDVRKVANSKYCHDDPEVLECPQVEQLSSLFFEDLSWHGGPSVLWGPLQGRGDHGGHTAPQAGHLQRYLEVDDAESRQDEVAVHVNEQHDTWRVDDKWEARHIGLPAVEA